MSRPATKYGSKYSRDARPTPAPDVGDNRATRRGGQSGITPGPTVDAPASDGLPHRHTCPRPEPVRLTYASGHGWALVKCPTCGAHRLERTSATDPDRSPA